VLQKMDFSFKMSFRVLSSTAKQNKMTIFYDNATILNEKVKLSQQLGFQHSLPKTFRFLKACLLTKRDFRHSVNRALART
jgi:hypothetical protein